MNRTGSIPSYRLGRFSCWNLLSSIALLLLPLAAHGQSSVRWEWVDRYEHCVGGDKCSHVGPLYLEIEDRPVESVRFEAHDGIGKKHNGELRVSIDAEVLSPGLLIAREPEIYQLSGRRARGRHLIIDPMTHDEVIIRKIEIAYVPSYADRGSPDESRDRDADRRGGRDDERDRYGAREPAPRRDEERRSRSSWGEDDRSSRDSRSPSGWRGGSSDSSSRGSERTWDGSSPRLAAVREVGCVGGSRCQNSRITVHFSRKGRVGLIRFYVHDYLGKRANGRLRIQLDDHELVDRLDIPKSGRIFELDGRGRIANSITFTPRSNDEVLIKDLEILEYSAPAEYSRQEAPRPVWKGSGICLGYDACDRGRILEVPLDGNIDAIRFFAHADLGRGYGRLRLVTNSGRILSDVDVRRAGEFHDEALAEDIRSLTLEAVDGDVVLEELELRSGTEWERYRLEEE